MRRLAIVTAVLAVGTIFAALPVPALAQAQDDNDGPVIVGACVGPHVRSVVQGDYLRHVPDRVIGDTPAVLDVPAGQKVGSLTAGTSYVVTSLRRGYALLRATRYSRPFAPGETVGWVRTSEVHDLALRNCN